jgi:hypothetical protein
MQYMTTMFWATKLLCTAFDEQAAQVCESHDIPHPAGEVPMQTIDPRQDRASLRWHVRTSLKWCWSLFEGESTSAPHPDSHAMTQCQ